MDRYSRMESIASMDSVKGFKENAGLCPHCGFSGHMGKPRKESLTAADDYSDSISERRQELREALGPRYPQKDTYVYVQDFGLDWVIYEVSGNGMDSCTYYQAPYSVMDNGDLTVGAPFEVRQTWTPVS